jgi:hypothetical protein
LRLAVFEHFKLFLRQVNDRIVLFIGDDDIDGHVVDAGTEGCLRVAGLRLRRGRLRVSRWLRCGGGRWRACLLLRTTCLLLRGACLLLRSACLLLRSACLLLRSACLLLRSACLLLRSACLLLRSAGLHEAGKKQHHNDQRAPV